MRAGIRFVKFTTNNSTLIVSKDGRIAKFALDDALAQATAINIRPPTIKFGTLVTSFGRATFDLELFEDGSSE